MAGKLIRDVSQAITGVAADGTITVASTTGFYEGAFGYLYKAGQTGVTVRILQVLSATTLTVKEEKDPRGTPGQFVGPSTYGRYNPASYNAGTISCPEQFVFNRNDQPLA